MFLLAVDFRGFDYGCDGHGDEWRGVGTGFVEGEGLGAEDDPDGFPLFDAGHGFGEFEVALTDYAGGIRWGIWVGRVGRGR